MSAEEQKTTSHAADGTPGEWGSDGLDVEAYLSRVRHHGDLGPSAGTLRALHRAHVAAIPFENLDIVLGRGISLDIDRLQDKLLRRSRGGYCYEHNLLFAALLERLGYRVTRLAARVQPGRPGPRGHMVLVVEADGGRWLADVGFGAGLLEPIPLGGGVVSRQGGWTYGLERREGGDWLLRSAAPGGWSDLYAFTTERQYLVDYTVYNHFTSTHPASPFVGWAVAIRTTPEVRHTIRGRELVGARPDGSTERCELSEDEFPAVLRETFRHRLGPRRAGELADRCVRRRAGRRAG